MERCRFCNGLLDGSKYWWDYSGYGYDSHLCRCSECEKINIMEYYVYGNMDVNNDKRYYEYERKVTRN